MDFEHSERARMVMDQVERFVRERVVPNEDVYEQQLVHTDDWTRWQIPPVLEELKAEARELGLWNLFLPDEEYGAGLDNRDYAPIAEITGRSFLAPEVFNCSAPDTGNAEVLVKYGSDEQKERWPAAGTLSGIDIRPLLGRMPRTPLVRPILDRPSDTNDALHPPSPVDRAQQLVAKEKAR